ncbi:hypothetical protein ACFFK0_16880 [Paenibacillus chartarius]|uniref:Uncharacterized protein n=1 Tax=Paenibacillus chartarius TaxID=747481 RepID=A0ABV6DN85_9BACL
MNGFPLSCHLLEACQWFAILMLALAVFRLKLAQFWPHNAISVLLVKGISLLAGLFPPLVSHIVPIQFALFFVALYKFYRFRPLYAMTIAVIGGFVALQSTALKYYLISIITSSPLNFSTDGLPWPQLHNVFTLVFIGGTMLLTWVLCKYRLGFTFVSVSDSGTKRGNRHFIAPLILFLIIIFAMPLQRESSMPYLPVMLTA